MADIATQLAQLKAQIDLLERAAKTAARMERQVEVGVKKADKKKKAVKAAKVKAHYCQGTTRDGEPCSNTIREGNYCHYHEGGKRVEKKTKPKKAVRCAGETKMGKQCKKETLNKSGLCYLHDSSDDYSSSE